MRCVLKKGIFDRWVLVHPDDDHLAWSGAQWVPHVNGLPAGMVQVCNFDSQADAEQYAADHGLEVVDAITQ